MTQNSPVLATFIVFLLQYSASCHGPEFYKSHIEEVGIKSTDSRNNTQKIDTDDHS